MAEKYHLFKRYRFLVLALILASALFLVPGCGGNGGNEVTVVPPITATVMPSPTVIPTTAQIATPTSQPTQALTPTIQTTQTLSPTPATPSPTATPTLSSPTPTVAPKTPVVTSTIPPGVVDPDFSVDVYNADKVWPGTTLLPDNHNPDAPRIIEVNMRGEIVWQYLVPQELKQYTNPGFDVELLPNKNILFVLPRKGVYEIDRSGKTVWSYLTGKISHDADRLPNGNTIFVYGANDQKADAQVVEVNPQGVVVWSWYARNYFDKSPYSDISLEGWTHTNAVTRLDNGNTLISLRNFNLIAEVDSTGAVVRTIGEGILTDQHDPEMLSDGNILLADHSEPQRALEINPATGEILWQFAVTRQLVRDADLLPNGNILITGATVILEVTPEKEIVWRFKLNEVLQQSESAGLGFYTAQRISQ